MAFCTYCGQSFQRNEHLERHLATHANIKRFKCGTCHLSYSRRDVLQRHLIVHGESGGDSTGADRVTAGGVSRHRTQEACRSCARTKTKCDASTPCNRCRARGVPCNRRPRKLRAGSEPRIVDDFAAGTPAIEPDAAHASTDTLSSQEGRGDGMDVEEDNRISSTDSSRESTRESGREDVSHSPHEAETPDNCGDPALRCPQGLPATQLAVSDAVVMETVISSWFDTFNENTPRPSVTHSNNTGAVNNEATVGPLVLQQSPLQGNWTASDSPRHEPVVAYPPEVDSSRIHGNPGEGFSSSHTVDLWQDAGDQVHHQIHHHDQWKTGTGETTEAAPAVDHPVIVEAYQYWSSFRCNPVADFTKCPRTAGVLLESLSQMPETDEFWGWLGPDFASPDPFCSLISLPLCEPVRDKLAAISQSLLQKALWVHQLDPAASLTASCYPSPSSTTAVAAATASTSGRRGLGGSGPVSGPGTGTGTGFRGFLILPPTATLEHFLREYMRIFEPFYPLLQSRAMDANSLMNGAHDTVSTLLILLMIGQGAISDPSNEARRLSGGLTEVCRISLFDVVEKNVSASHHHLLLHCSLVFAVQAAWSGDKWLMDIGLGQQGIYLGIIRHSALFEYTEEASPSSEHHDTEYEYSQRLIRVIYAWVVLDLEFSLFHDTAPQVQIADLNLSLPRTNEATTEMRSPTFAAAPGPSLRTLFQWFLSGKQASRTMRSLLSPTVMRLLLHPLHCVVHGHRQMLSCFGDGPVSLLRAAPITKRLANVRMEEAQVLLQRWYDLYRTCLRDEVNGQRQHQPPHTEDVTSALFLDFRSPLMSAALVTYHTIYLNTATDFVEIERFARCGTRHRTDAQLFSQMHPRQVAHYLFSCEDALWHSGQILRLLNTFDPKVRPPWWPAALYRVTLTLWTASVFYGPRWREATALDKPIALIDAEPSENDAGEIDIDLTGIPALTDRRMKGVENEPGGPLPPSVVTLEDPIRTIEACLCSLASGVTTRFSEGIHVRLTEFLSSRYAVQTP